MTGYYWGTAGWQDAAAQSPSRERAIRESSDGTLSKRMADVLALAATQGTVGITFRDIDRALGTHHGQSSSALSNLHKQGQLFRLTEYRREKCSVYIHPVFADRFSPQEYTRQPSETAAERRKKEAQQNERLIKELMDEIDHLKRRLGES